MEPTCNTVLHEKHSSKRNDPEGFQRATGKPFGRARRRETSALGKAIVLNKDSIPPSLNSITARPQSVLCLAGPRLYLCHYYTPFCRR